MISDLYTTYLGKRRMSPGIVTVVNGFIILALVLLARDC